MPGRRSLHPDEPRGGLPPDVQQVLVVKEEDPWIPSLDQQDPEGLNIKEEEDQLWTSPEEKPFHGQETDIRKFSGLPADVQQMLEVKEEDPWIPSLDQQDPEGLNIKEEEDQLWTSPDEKPFHAQETDIRKFSGLPADVQQVLVVKEEDPWIPSLDQQDPEGLNIKEEEDQLWTSPEEKPFHGQETDIRKFPGSAVTVKSENEEEKPELSQLYQIKTEGNRESEPPSSSSAEQMKAEADGEDCGGPEAAGNPDLDDPLASNTDEQTSDSSETEVSDEDYWGKSSDTLPETVDGNRNWKPTAVSDSGVTHNKDINTAGKPYSCSECGKEFLCKLYFNNHSKFHTEEKPFDCHTYAKRFKKKNYLQCHMRFHTVEKPFTCNDCGKTFSHTGSLITHTIVHTGEKPFVCTSCGKIFSRNSSLKTHIRNIHKGEKTFACNECGKRFSKRETLTRHTRVHTGEKPFSCNDCGKRFSERGALKVHTRVHTGEKPFSCNDCAKRFRKRETLTRHTRVHTGEKPFSCNDCGKSFSDRGALIVHTRVHTGKKPFSCNDCGKRFSDRVTLKVHTRVHTGEKPFSCSDCSKRFSVRGNLKRHMKVHMRAKTKPQLN
ncbi:uncharacterized protein ACNS7B_017341 isoform 1-T1 [Menidia menidia]